VSGAVLLQKDFMLKIFSVCEVSMAYISGFLVYPATQIYIWGLWPFA